MTQTPSRQKIFICTPASAADEAPCAQKIISNLAQRAFRRPVTDEDLQPLLAFYAKGREGATFDVGIRDAVSAILASPYFLYSRGGDERQQRSRAERPGTCLAYVILHLEQRAGSRTAGRGDQEPVVEA